jgi:hypothetical protein
MIGHPSESGKFFSPSLNQWGKLMPMDDVVAFGVVYKAKAVISWSIRICHLSLPRYSPLRRF